MVVTVLGQVSILETLLQVPYLWSTRYYRHLFLPILYRLPEYKPSHRISNKFRHKSQDGYIFLLSIGFKKYINIQQTDPNWLKLIWIYIICIFYYIQNIIQLTYYIPIYDKTNINNDSILKKHHVYCFITLSLTVIFINNVLSDVPCFKSAQLSLMLSIH